MVYFILKILSARFNERTEMLLYYRQDGFCTFKRFEGKEIQPKASEMSPEVFTCAHMVQGGSERIF